jgi:hypothetical protein
VAEDWKQRLAFRADREGNQVARTSRLGVLVSVRALYPGIALRALEGPSWVQWAVPSPVRQSDLAGFAKEKKQVQARMHQRIRERLPRLPGLPAAAGSHHADQAELLAAAEAAAIGQAFEHAGRRYRRISREQDRAPRRLRYRQSMILAEDLDSGVQHDITRSEDEAFCALAIIETLRHPDRGTAGDHAPGTGVLSAPRHRRSPPLAADRPVQEQRGKAAAPAPSWPPSSAGCEATTTA